jgi:transposase-like protein
MEAAKAFFAQAYELAEHAPERVVSDGHSAYPRAIAETLGDEVEHEVRHCVDNPIEQSHRGVKQRYYPTLGFGSLESAKQFCQVFEEVRQFLRPRTRMAEFVSLSDQKERFLKRASELQAIFQAG